MTKRSAALLASLILCLGTFMTGCSSSDNDTVKSETTAGTSAAAETEKPESSKPDTTTTASAADGTVTEESNTEAAEETLKERPTNIIDGIDYLTLVSHGFRLPDGWEENTPMVTFSCGQDYEVTVESRTYEAYLNLKNELEQEGVFIDIDTGYRRVADQVEIRQRYRERYGEEYIQKFVAVPGYSEHHTGLAIDLCLIVDGEYVIYNEDLVKHTDIWAKIHEKLAKYGFILRYPEDKEDITKFAYEPWHIRYVGEEYAKEITDKGLTLEEYLGVTIPMDKDVFEEPQIPRNTETIYQVALLQSLAQGFYDGILSVDALKEKGDTGLGTFDGVNGEMIVVDGEVYRANSKGEIEKPEGDEMIPFADVTWFDVDGTSELKNIKDINALKKELDKLVDGNKNMFCMVKIDGEFTGLKARSETKQEKPYKMLDEALAESQTEFEFGDMKGTLIGLYCPDYAAGLNTPGWHLHFISEDRTKGGHVLSVGVKEATAEYDITPGFKMYMYDDSDFQKLDLAKNVDKVIESAETKSKDD